MKHFCALCLDPIIGNPKKQPLGRNDALVNVCDTCDSAHPRSGLYAFDDASKHGGSENRNAGMRRVGGGGFRKGKS